MANATNQRIIVRSGPNETRLEALAGEAGIGPGDLLEWSAGTFLRHNTGDGAVMPKMIATESQHPDDEDNASIDVDYANADTVYAWIPRVGDHAYMFLAAGETALQHSYLVSDGDGALAVEAAITNADIIHAVVGRAVAAVDNALGGAPVRVLVEIA